MTARCRPHFHVPQRGDSEVQVLEGFGALVGIVVRQQLGELQAGKRFQGEGGPSLENWGIQYASMISPLVDDQIPQSANA